MLYEQEEEKLNIKCNGYEETLTMFYMNTYNHGAQMINKKKINEVKSRKTVHSNNFKG